MESSMENRESELRRIRDLQLATVHDSLKTRKHSEAELVVAQAKLERKRRALRTRGRGACARGALSAALTPARFIAAQARSGCCAAPRSARSPTPRCSSTWPMR
jgi:hypothetical protein